MFGIGLDCEEYVRRAALDKGGVWEVEAAASSAAQQQPSSSHQQRAAATQQQATSNSRQQPAAACTQQLPNRSQQQQPPAASRSVHQERQTSICYYALQFQFVSLISAVQFYWLFG